MKTRISSKGQLVLPSELRRLDGVEAGEEFEVERVEPGAYLLRRLPKPSGIGVVDWLLSCPERDWFKRVESESTDTL
ncbi:MAG: AbrB/MazE/SpoVT family DNA-binding domain-containing protein [Verrucomicrobiales bacterium]|nr:AbrB/MazE/SpoVT family DNA-binding domain-containing protein [Verrucomicrobiales bacterium]